VANSSATDVVGKSPDQLAWLKRVNTYSKEDHPWTLAIRERRVVSGIEYATRAIAGRSLRLIANYAPVLDGNNAVRGCMVTFNDVTEIERANEKLMEALTDLAANKEAIQSKNNELERLASRDALTGCFNRRVFFERFGILFQDARGRGLELACIMGDIDKFKLINDTHGHQVGDQVIQSFAAILQGAVRGEDLVGRYGGEEFCIVLVGANLEVAMRLAERIRRTVELECGSVVNVPSGLRVTCSLGVSSIRLAAVDPAAMVDQADQALYYAKQNGRNRVTSFSRIMEAVV
jgi:diguanylate cyclase (GGDEF)-like protein